ncbi:hypothetical protein [Rhizobium rhizogenes]|uniref:hypothetical protein n=1 Tax=Rhizobium rhizogenes TaxID=359 RepID=UPI0015721023|nr:hypothetical protein [Rhizobium rhizogenes]NTH18427.1 hypothetical protein [Rhizobium rhizogenes]NTH31400.1 hypothetical protein [Rhizobium rhizogenes]
MGKLRKTGFFTLATLGLTAAITLTSASISEAGFRSSGGGFRSSSSFRSSSFSSRSYSARPSYSSPRPSYRSNNTTVENHYYGGGGGGGFSSGGFLSGYLWGSILNHQTTPAPAAAPSVVVVPGATAPAAAPVSPNVSTPAAIAPTQAAPQVVQQSAEEGEGSGISTFLGYLVGLAFIVLVGSYFIRKQRVA